MGINSFFKSLFNKKNFQNRSFLFLLAIIIFHLVWRITLAFAYPLFDMADELFHFDYIYQISNGDGLINVYTDPITTQVFDLAKDVGHWTKEGIVSPNFIGDVSTEMIESIRVWGWYAVDITGSSSYEGVQPPLYHAIASIFMGLTDSMEIKAYIVRLVSIGFSTLLLLSTYVLMKKITQKEFIALGSILLLSVSPSWSLQAFRISNDVAAQFFIVFGLLIFYRFLNVKDETKVSSAVILGIIVGLAGLTKSTSLIILMFSLFVMYIFLSTSTLKLKVKGFSIILIVASVISFWFYLRNFMLYDDFVGGQTILNAIYLENIWVATNIQDSFFVIGDLTKIFLFVPFQPNFGFTLREIVINLWLITMAIMIIRLIIEMGPRIPIDMNRYFVTFAPLSYLFVIIGTGHYVLGSMFMLIGVLVTSFIVVKDKIKKLNPVLTTMFLSATFMMYILLVSFTFTIGPISDRYLMTISGIAVGFAVYSVDTMLRPTTRTIFLAILIGLLFVVSITQEINILERLIS